MSTASEITEDIFNAYHDLEDQFPELLPACSLDERKTLIARRDTLRDLFWKAAASELQDFNATVQHLHDGLRKTHKQLNQELATTKNVTAIIGLVTEIIKFAGAILLAAAI